MKACKICRKVKISISPWGGNFQFSARGERYVYLKKIHPRVNFTSPTCNMPLNRQQRYRPRKQLTRSRNVHDTDSSLFENNHKEIVYVNKGGVLVELCGYLGPKKDKNTKKIWWSSEHPVATGRLRKCDTISGRISCLAPNSRANNIENIEDTFHLYFNNDIMGKIVDCTNTRIYETIARLRRSGNVNESSKYT